MVKDILIIISIFIFFAFKVFIQFNKIKELKIEVIELQQDLSYSAHKLDSCKGKVTAFNKAFDYHVVLSELGLYPAIKEELYLSKGKGESE